MIIRGPVDAMASLNTQTARASTTPIANAIALISMCTSRLVAPDVVLTPPSDDGLAGDDDAEGEDGVDPVRLPSQFATPNETRSLAFFTK